ncbi:MAG TPA: HPr family phosphocarrier protein [Brevundimonas sp.]|uniref:HPr family phosphocarrier protein n=1 Tax=Brevundimonas sp. TaxID=1871086 RepID=UPI002620445D|nr:HPr family phosphocarrier protein [Brevundimonas sp.]HRO32403.1 HPr family phosphocarrier protein [Brevundimonas sp.]
MSETDTAQNPTRAIVGICNQRGLHARASAKFVKLASVYEAEVKVTRDGVTVDARSIMGLLMLGAGNGCDVTIEAEGPDAAEAVAALAELVQRRFDEDQ